MLQPFRLRVCRVEGLLGVLSASDEESLQTIVKDFSIEMKLFFRLLVLKLIKTCDVALFYIVVR